MTHILNQIVKDKALYVKHRKALIEESKLIATKSFERSCYSLLEYSEGLNYPWVISEFKRKSPSKPNIDLDAKIEIIVPQYVQAGAAALSVLTDTYYFGGSYDDLIKAREITELPILRKEFIIEAYQVIESKSLGADLILLIAEILTKAQVKELSHLAKECGMEVILELHSADQIDKYNEAIDFIGINNRDLTQFTTNIQTSIHIFSKLPSEVMKISESGIKNIADVQKLFTCGYKGFLIGEYLMSDKGILEGSDGFISQVKNIRC